MTAVIHIVGVDVQVGDQLRQRCSWCGAVLIDYDLTRVATIDGKPPATFPVGELLAIEGAMAWTVDHNAGDQLPDGCCGRLDHDVTGSR